MHEADLLAHQENGRRNMKVIGILKLCNPTLARISGRLPARIPGIFGGRVTHILILFVVSNQWHWWGKGGIYPCPR
jgi:hypothetical protein